MDPKPVHGLSGLSSARRERWGNTTGNSCATNWCCGAVRARRPNPTSAPATGTSSNPKPAGNSPACGWPAMSPPHSDFSGHFERTWSVHKISSRCNSPDRLTYSASLRIFAPRIVSAEGAARVFSSGCGFRSHNGLPCSFLQIQLQRPAIGADLFWISGRCWSSVAGGSWWSLHKYEYLPKRWGVVVPGKIYRSGQLTPAVLARQVAQAPASPRSLICSSTTSTIRFNKRKSNTRPSTASGTFAFRSAATAPGNCQATPTRWPCSSSANARTTPCSSTVPRAHSGPAAWWLATGCWWRKPTRARFLRNSKPTSGKPQEDAALLDYLNTRLPELAARLVERGSLPAVPRSIPHLSE